MRAVTKRPKRNFELVPVSLNGRRPEPSSQRSRGVLALLVPLVLVNCAAIWGQAGWAFDHVTNPAWDFAFRVALALMFASAVESIGIYLAWEAHEARMASQPSGMLRYASFGMGALAGWLNYDHFDGTMAIAFAALSVSSPFLWAVWSAARNRVRLAELGELDARGVRLGAARKFWHPVKSLRVIRWAAWEGVSTPADAVRGWTLMATPAPVEAPVSGGNPAQLTPEEILAKALQMKADDPSMSWGTIAVKLNVSERYLRTLRSKASGK